MSTQVLEIFKGMLKNEKTQRMIILMLSGIIAFSLGYMSKNCPPKSEVCKAEMKNNGKLFTQIKEEREEAVKKERNITDELNKACDIKLITRINEYKAKEGQVDCRICKALSRQCKAKGKW